MRLTCCRFFKKLLLIGASIAIALLFFFLSKDVLLYQRHFPRKGKILHVKTAAALTHPKVFRSSKLIPSTFEDIHELASHEYLSPVNVFKSLSGRNASSIGARTKDTVHRLFHTGYGSTKFVTEDGKTAWMENGVVFRPLRPELELMVNHAHMNHSHPSDYEYYVPFDKEKFFEGKKIPLKESLTDKTILWYDSIGYIQTTPHPERMKLCPDFPCRITTNREYANESSAMIFDGISLSPKPPPRKADQVFIFHFVERPTLTNKSKLVQKLSTPDWQSAFNWTMTFRVDADIPIFYGLVRKRPIPVVKDYKAIIASKTKLVVSLMSNCASKSNREQYVKRLQGHVHVDIFGKCGKTKHACTRANDTDCAARIVSDYKFYLGFESALCGDYITEKLFRYLALDVIVVARGDESYFHHVPPEIYINTADFESPRHLAQRLIYLDNHPEEYEAMLREKDKYVGLYETWLTLKPIVGIYWVHFHYEAVGHCKVCQRLWNMDSYAKTIPNINAWFLNRTCTIATDFGKGQK